MRLPLSRLDLPHSPPIYIAVLCSRHATTQHAIPADGYKCELEALYALGIDHVNKYLSDAIRLRDYI